MGVVCWLELCCSQRVPGIVDLGCQQVAVSQSVGVFSLELTPTDGFTRSTKDLY